MVGDNYCFKDCTVCVFGCVQLRGLQFTLTGWICSGLQLRRRPAFPHTVFPPNRFLCMEPDQQQVSSFLFSFFWFDSKAIFMFLFVLVPSLLNSSFYCSTVLSVCMDHMAELCRYMAAFIPYRCCGSSRPGSRKFTLDQGSATGSSGALQLLCSCTLELSPNPTKEWSKFKFLTTTEKQHKCLGCLSDDTKN